MPDPHLMPQQWVAAANMVQRRGQRLRVVPVTIKGYQLQLPDGTALAYVDNSGPRSFRSVDQAIGTVQGMDLSIDANALELPG